MSDSVPDDLWRRRILTSLLVHETVCVRATCRAKAAVVTAALLVERIDASLARHSLTGLIDIDRTAPLPFTYALRAAYVLEQDSNEWRGMGPLIRLVAIYRLTPANGLPLVLSAQWLTARLPSRTAFHQLPLAMAIYRLFGHLLTDVGTSLALQQADDNGAYRIGSQSFRVVPLGELPAGHPYAEGYKRTDPVVRFGPLYRSFSAFLLYGADIGRGDPRYGRLLTDAVTEDSGIAVDSRNDGFDLNDAAAIDYRHVIVSGFRPGETVAAHMYVWLGSIQLYTTEISTAAGRPASLSDRYSVSVGAARRVLRGFGLESDVVDRGRVLG
ncbi:unnamed protein product [Vitrella brassicaformis CCMP3155]|uniref:Uncharacterized protein n=1 Tax=Vitrella brassicaformis (strain CCMP3155) TaxID=1169540 RepID=A0A0G4G951_VITBC|nr:unnamed protein product [Vitrella brassicaformis CCMP3155]|eukprot:CEM25405.1 unnamed protein product [Vitrella brassicaformis CCMP3155]